MENLEVRAYRWRYTVVFGMTYAVSQQIFYLLRRGHLEPWAILAVAPLVALWAAIGSSERYHLRIVDGVFSGPAPRGLERVHFSISEIDRVRSSRRNLFGGRTVWSQGGDAIYIDPITVPKAGRLLVLRAPGLVTS